MKSDTVILKNRFTHNIIIMFTAILNLLIIDGSADAQGPKGFALGAFSSQIPYPNALNDANVSLSSIDNGQHKSMLVGNGDFYGIIWENNGNLFMRVTKNDIWDARVDTSGDGPLPKVNVITGAVTGSTGAPPSYNKVYPQPRCAAALRIGTGTADAAGKATGYLNIRKAVATVKESDQTETIVRILKNRNVVLIDSPHSVTIEEIKASSLPAASTGKTEDTSWLFMNMPGDVDYEGMDYALAVTEKGNLKAVSLVSSFDIQSGDVLQSAIALTQSTINEEKNLLIAAHEKAWENFWTRSGVKLADKALQRWWYRILYYAGTVSRPGTAPVGLMPPLATDATPWHADYHHNYNTWQMFWPLPVLNHPELADPWISYINNMIPRFQFLARETYNCDGICCPISSFLHEPDPAVCTSKNKRQLSMNPWGMTIGLVGMTTQSLWQKHLCDPDQQYLESKIYPALREAARFYVSYMAKCKKDTNGKIILGPSYSPEHGPMGISNCPFDIAYVHYTFDAFVKAARELNTDNELITRCLDYKVLLPDYPTAMDNNGKPVVVDWAGCHYKQVAVHNITVPAVPVFPGEQITWFSPESVKELFRHTIKDTVFNGNNSHVMFNIAKARLSMPEAVVDAKNWFTSRELPNGLFVWPGHHHGTFMSEMTGIAGLINEYMLQSVKNIIRVFPCWPDNQDAAFRRLRAQGGFLVSAQHKDGKVVSVLIESTVGGQLKVLSPWSNARMTSVQTGQIQTLALDENGIGTVNTQAGDTFLFQAE